MNPRVTLGLAALLVLVGLYIFVVDRPQAQRAEEARHLVQLVKTDVTAVTLTSAKGTVELTRRDATHWVITKPFAAPATTFSVDDVIDAVTALIPQRTLKDAGSDLAPYGLDAPAARITLRTTAGKAITVEVGKASPVATAIYVRATPGSGVVLVDSSFKDTLSKSAGDFRQKSLTDFNNGDVQKVQITSPKGSLALDRVGPDRWRLTGARPWPADDFKVSDLFFPLTTTESKTFHDGVTDLVPYGLDHPEVTVDLTLKGRTTPLRVLLATRGKIVYGMVAGTQNVLEFDPAFEAKLTPDPIALVSLRVLPYNAQNLTAVVWRRSARTLEVRRQGPGFTGGGMADKDILDMFSSLNILDAETVQPLAAAPAGSPAFEIRTDGAEDAKFSVAFYHQPDGKWLATDQALGLQYRLTSNALDGFPQPIKVFLGVAPPTKPGASGTPTSPGKPGPATAPAPGLPSPGGQGPKPAVPPSP